jgi:glycosyltransferase involved in cell wall biosynthesis
MNVLHLPHNVGSKITLTVSALRKQGADAKGIAINNYLDSAGENVRVFNPREYSYLNPKKYSEYFNAKKCIEEYIRWADVVHWYYEPVILKTDRFVELVHRLNKPAVVEWIGSDIRIAEQLSQHNPYYKKAFENDYPYRSETKEHSRMIQEKFKEAGFFPLVRPELEEFIQKDIFPAYQTIHNRIDIASYSFKVPQADKKVPLIVHPVTSRPAKGTGYILDAVERLRKKYEFDFILLENIPHEEVVAKMTEADIVIDQLIIGAFGTITLEGMALGKPAVCFIDEVLKKKLSADCPIINSDPDKIYSTLETLLANPELRHSTGLRSRKYVEEHHDADKIAAQLMKIYSNLIETKGKRKS